eukprot:356051-Chlamydomonas_euryale.AAC.6
MHGKASRISNRTTRQGYFKHPSQSTDCPHWVSTCENIAWNIADAVSCASMRRGSPPLVSTSTRSITARGATIMDVTYNGIASVAHSSETNVSIAKQCCFSGSCIVDVHACEGAIADVARNPAMARKVALVTDCLRTWKIGTTSSVTNTTREKVSMMGSQWRRQNVKMGISFGTATVAPTALRSIATMSFHTVLRSMLICSRNTP